MSTAMICKEPSRQARCLSTEVHRVGEALSIPANKGFLHAKVCRPAAVKPAVPRMPTTSAMVLLRSVIPSVRGVVAISVVRGTN